jgi:hypothetical protein
MARGERKLKAITLRSLAAGMHSDGGGLWLQVTKSGARSWIFRFTLAGHAREMGLGPLHTVSLAEAREGALMCRKQLREGQDPIEMRKAKRMAEKIEAAELSRVRRSLHRCPRGRMDECEARWAVGRDPRDLRLSDLR